MRPIQGSAADLATLATLGSVLQAVERPFGLPCRRSSAALCELAGPSQIGLGDRSRFSVRVMTIARPPRQGNALRFRLALGLTARSQSASRGSRAAGGCIGSTRSACEPRWAKPGLGETGRHQPRMVVVRRQFGRKRSETWSDSDGLVRIVRKIKPQRTGAPQASTDAVSVSRTR